MHHFECPLTLRDHNSLQNVHYILGIGVTLLNGTVYNMNKPGYSFNAILSSPSFISIFLAVESTFCIYSLYIKKKQI